MKRTTATSIFAVALAGLILGATLARADDKGCSNATLKGTFGVTNTGLIVAPPQFAGAFAGVGTQIFDGKGGTNATATVSANGNIVKVTITGTYTVNPDCTGFMTLNISPVGVTNHATFVIVDDGAEIRAINTDPGSVITTVIQRQFPVGDWRQ
jgi:hypothetical protein